MNTRRFFHFFARVATVALGTFVLSSLAVAGPGHDHDHPVQSSKSAASPRFETHTDLFELVGIYERGGLTLYLDRYKTNEPIANAKIEYEAAGAKGIATAQPDGTYRIESDALKAAKGTIALAFTITQGNEADLLAANLALQDASRVASDDHDHTHLHFPLWALFVIALFLLAMTALTIFFVKRRKAAARPI
jgi:hypothetical protein